MFKPFLAALGLLSIAGVAGAHVTLEQAEAAAGVTTKITLRIPHGCEGQATQAVTLQVPDGFYAAKPMPKAGWVLETVTGPYAAPYDNHGTAMTEGVRQIVWSQGNLDDAWYDEFTLRGTVGPDVAPRNGVVFSGSPDLCHSHGRMDRRLGQCRIGNARPRADGGRRACSVQSCAWPRNRPWRDADGR